MFIVAVEGMLNSKVEFLESWDVHRNVAEEPLSVPVLSSYN